MFKPFGEDFIMWDFNWEPVVSWVLGHGIRVLIILAIGAGLWFCLQKFIRPLVYHAIKRTKGESWEGIRKRTDTLTGVFVSTGKVLIVLIIILMILSELDIPIGPALAGLGIAGVAFGFGAQYLVRDLIAGIFVILENQYRVGDVVKVADIVGMVEEVNLRRTVLRDLDGVLHHVPNGEIRVASNYTRRFARVNLNISVSYGTDLDHAIRVINRVGKKLAEDKDWGERILNAPRVLRVNKLGDSGIDIKILGDVKPLAQWDVMGELRLRLKKAFDKEGIEIPWPHLKLYFGESPADSGLVCKACSQVNLPGSKFCSRCGAKLKG
jgi:small-conductance mechanosensitive channel